MQNKLTPGVYVVTSHHPACTNVMSTFTFVRLSVKHVNCGKTEETSAKILIRYLAAYFR